MKHIQIQDLQAIALGSAIYGTGGGGDPYIGRLLATETMKQYGPVQLVELDDLPPDAYVISVALAGAPTVLLEKLADTNTLVRALQRLEQALGRKAQAIFSAEVGGLNSVIPISVASQLGLPLIDCDTMGRAFPQLQMTLATLAGIDIGPVALADERGNEMFITTANNAWMEKLVRTALVQMGGAVHMALLPMTAQALGGACVRGSISQAWRTGDALLKARSNHTDPVQAITQATAGHLLFTGKVTGIERVVRDGWTFGIADIEGLGEYAGQKARIEYQNEFLVFYRDGKLAACTPDLICATDIEYGQPITGEQIAYGFRMAILGINCHPAWLTPQGLNLVGPRQFGYDTDYRSLSECLNDLQNNR